MAETSYAAKLTLTQARHICDLLDRCAAALERGDVEGAADLASDAGNLAFRGSRALNDRLDALEWAFHPDDDASGCVRCGNECPHCGPAFANPKVSLPAARLAALRELEAIERAAYIPRKAVHA